MNNYIAGNEDSLDPEASVPPVTKAQACPDGEISLPR